jgi:protocatechuate 3,4-dioxygenase beta subunit
MSVRRLSLIAPFASILLSVPALFAQAGTPLGAGQAPPELKATISGSVVRATTGEPIGRATVTLTRVSGPTNPLAPGGPNAGGARGGGRGAQVPPGQRGQAQGQGQDQSLNVTSTTDDQGKFQFKDLEGGSYRVVAARNGFARQEYGQRSFNRPGTVLNVAAGQTVNDVSFKLTPAGTISGRVMDSNGEPLVGVTIQALRSTFDATGKRALQPAASARTNDLGEYRLYWINPGRYFVNANSARSAFELITSGASQAASQAQSPQEAQAASQAAALFGPAANPNEVTDTGFGLTFYPGTTDASRAVALELPSGGELRAIDFTLVRTQRVKLTGRVVDAETGMPPQNATVSVSPRDSAGSSSPFDALIGMNPQGSRYNSLTGEFTVQNVASGSYWLQVFAQGRPQAGGAVPNAPPANPADVMGVLVNIKTARIPIEVSGSDMDNLSLTVSAGISIPGRIRIDGAQAASQNLSSFGVSLQPDSGFSLLSVLAGATPRPAADGTFSLPRITNGDYGVAVSGLGQNFYIKSVRHDQTDVLQSGLRVSQPFNGTLEVTLGMNPGQVVGVVTDSALKPVSGVQAVLIPDQLRSRQDLYKSAVTDQEGRFTFRGVTPGDYRLFSWEDIEPFSYFDSDVLNQYEGRGKLVRVQESSSESVEVRLIPVAQ